jgi:hypothetical protein
MGFQDIYLSILVGQIRFSANSGKNARVLIVVAQNLRATVDFSNFMALHCIYLLSSCVLYIEITVSLPVRDQIMCTNPLQAISCDLRLCISRVDHLSPLKK